jgi:predicted nucleotidyltransferase
MRVSNITCVIILNSLVMDPAVRGTCKSLLAHPFLTTNTSMPEWPFRRVREASESDIDAVVNAVVTRLYPNVARFGSMADTARMMVLAQRLGCSVDLLTNKMIERLRAQPAATGTAIAVATVTTTTPNNQNTITATAAATATATIARESPPTPAMGSHHHNGHGAFAANHHQLPRSRGDSR